MCGVLITDVKWFNFKKGTVSFSRINFVNEVVSAKKVGILRQRACDGKVKNTCVVFSKKVMFNHVVAKHFLT